MNLYGNVGSGRTNQFGICAKSFELIEELEDTISEFFRKKYSKESWFVFKDHSENGGEEKAETETRVKPYLRTVQPSSRGATTP